MRILVASAVGAILTFVLSGLAPSESAETAMATWPVSIEDVNRLEATLHLPGRAQPIVDYARYYSGQIIDERRIIVGHIIKGMGYKPGIYLNQPWPDIADGGCSVVTVYYDIEKQAPAGVVCNGYG